MKLRKVISGGQTGADKTGLACARQIGLETGGTVPKGCRTDEGVDLSLVEIYGCVESDSSDYKPRTKQNVKDGEVTLWFGKTNSPGYWCTRNACKEFDKPFYENPLPEVLKMVADHYEVVNVAGNRRRLNPEVVRLVTDAFTLLKELQNETESK